MEKTMQILITIIWLNNSFELLRLSFFYFFIYKISVTIFDTDKCIY